MGTIIGRTRKDGTTAYLAQILLKRKGQIVHREVQTFDRKQAAKAWLARRETELSDPARLIERMTPHSQKRFTATSANPSARWAGLKPRCSRRLKNMRLQTLTAARSRAHGSSNLPNRSTYN